MPADPSRLDTTWSAGEEILRRFEAAWRDGSRPDLSQFLPADGSHPPRLVAELAHVDLEFRLRAGDPARAEEYFARFPELAEPRVAVELIAAEFGLRHRLGPPPPADEYTARFPQYREALADVLSAGGVAETRSSHRATDIPVGTPTIAGCRIGDELGRGGMGVVYHAYQSALGRAVAVKTFLSVPSAEAADRFRREAETVARLDHPHIVPIYEVGAWSAAGRDVPYFVMKLYPGGNLDAVPCGPGTDVAGHARTVEIVAQAVHHAHRRGVLHRDLKPSNILLDESGAPHVADFGLAGWFDPAAPRSVAGAAAGTPAFMAPEQAKANSRVTVAADVYGLGALLYHQLTGKPPFRAATAMATLELLTKGTPVPPSKVNAAVPRDLEAVCLKCLSREPGKRYASAEEVADDLDRWRTGRPVQARPTPAWEHAWRAARRHPLSAVLTVLTALAVVAVVAILAVSRERLVAEEQATADALRRERLLTAELTATAAREQKAVYLDRVALAGRLYAVNQLPQAGELLADCPPHLRGWEWKYLTGLIEGAPPPVGTHPAWVTGVAFLADGRLVSADEAGGVRVWDAAARAEQRAWRTDPVAGLAAHPKDPVVATVSPTGVTVWDADTGRAVRTVAGTRWVGFSPDGATLAVIDGPTLRLHDAATGAALRELACSPALVSAAFSPDGGTLATSEMGVAVRLWNPRTGQPVGPPRSRPLPVRRLAFTSDGKHLIEDRPSGLVVVTSAATGEVLEAIDAVAKWTGLAVGPHAGRVAVTGPHGEVLVWDTAAGSAWRTFRGHTAEPGSLAFSRDGKRVASGAGDRTVRVWDVDAPPECREFAAGGEPLDLAVAPDGARVAVTVRPVRREPGTAARVLDAVGREAFKVAEATGAAFSPDGSLVVVAKRGGVDLVAVATGVVKWPALLPGVTVTRVAYSPDGRLVAAGDLEGTVRLYSAASGAGAGSWHAPGGPISGLAFTPDGRRLVVTNFGAHAARDLAAAADVWAVRGGLVAAVSPDGAWVATADGDRALRLRDAATGAVVRTFAGSPVMTMSVAFSPDGRRLVSATERSAAVWDVESGRELLTLPGTAPDLAAVAWVGQRVYALDDKLRVWDAGGK